MAGCSERSHRPWGQWAAPLLAAALLVAQDAAAQGGLTQQEALRLAFPEPAVVERRTAFLSAAQVAQVRALVGEEAGDLPSVVTYYLARRAGRVIGVAYFDSHRVRTLPEVLMFVVGPEGTIQRAEVVQFSEPPEYRPMPAWLAQLLGRPLTPEFSLKGDLRTMTGATLTSRAAVRAARRILALHAVIQPIPAGAGK